MGKGDRTNLERLLRAAWTYQIADSANSEVMAKQKKKSSHDTPVFLAIISAAAVPLAYVLQANGVVDIRSWLCLLIYLGIIVVFVWTFLKWDRAAEWNPIARFVVCGLVVMILAGFSAVGVRNQFMKEHLKSILELQAHMERGYGPGYRSTQIDMNVRTPQGDAIQNVDLVLTTASKRIIHSIEAIPSEEGDCKVEPINTFGDQAITITGAGKEGGLTIDTKDTVDDFLRTVGSTQWKLACQRLSANTYLGFRLTIEGNAENDSINAIGTYELIPSHGSTVVKVDTTIPAKS